MTIYSLISDMSETELWKEVTHFHMFLHVQIAKNG